MADREHLAILMQGVEVWNEWRDANPEVEPDLSYADLSYADLSYANLKDASLEGANLTGANLASANLKSADLRGANLTDADFRSTNLINADLTDVNFRGTNLINADLTGADLTGADLYRAILWEAILKHAKLSGAEARDTILKHAKLSGADLSYADLTGADLTGADLTRSNLTECNLRQAKALSTNFEGTTLTGVCIQDWNINADTNLNDVICDYVYLKYEQKERRPSDPNRNFAPGEFTTLFQKALETIDLIFADGIDWRAFFQSFQELQTQYADEELSIQAIEKKPGGAFVIRLETPAIDVDKAAIEAAAMEKYQAQLLLLESRYEERLQLQGEQLEFYRQQVIDYRHQNTSLIEVVRSMASRPVIITNTNTLEATAMSNSQSGDTYNGNIKATNFAPRGTAIGGTFNDYSQTITNNLDEIGQLIKTLRLQAEQFPQDARDDVDVHLGDLEDDLKHPEKQDPKRIKAKLMALLAIAVGLGGAISTATDFTNNVLELGKKFGVELVHPQGTPSAPSPPSPPPQGTPTVDVKRLDGGAP